MARTGGNLGLEIPADDLNFRVTLNERLRRIAQEIELARGSRTAAAEVAPVETTVITSTSLPSVTGALKIIDGVISVKGEGITTDLIRQFAISADRIKAGAVGTLQLSDLAVTTAKIQNLAITNALIANLAVTDAKIGSLAANKITAGTMNAVNLTAGTVTLTANGITTSITNVVDPFLGVPLGLKVTNNTTGGYAGVNEDRFILSDGFSGIAFLNKAGGRGQMRLNDAVDATRYITCNVGGAGSPLIELGSLGTTIRLSVLSPTPRMLFNGVQVVGPQIAGWGSFLGVPSRVSWNPATVTLNDLARTVGAILTDLRTHGLIAP